MREIAIEDIHHLLFNQAAIPLELDPWKRGGCAISSRLRLDVGTEVEDRIVNVVLGALTYRNREQIRRIIDRLAGWPAGDKRQIDLLSYWGRIGDKYLDCMETFYVKPPLFESWRRQMHAADEDLPALALLARGASHAERRGEMFPELFDQWPTFIRGNDPQLYRELSKGFGCLHLHLSGAYPAPYFWVGLMNRRFNEASFTDLLSDGGKNLRGFRTAGEISDLVALITLARKARAALFKFVSGRTNEEALERSGDPCTFLDAPIDETPGPEKDETDYAQRDVHHWRNAVCPSLVGERFLLFRAIRSIGIVKDERIAERLSRILWAYVVAKHRFLGTVQQPEGIAGFDYFEHTFRLLRWRSEEGDETRSGEEIGNFLQESGGLVKLELMIAPRNDRVSYQRDIALASAIRTSVVARQSATAATLCGRPRVGLVVHFLKDHGEPLDKRLTDSQDAYLAYHHGVRDRVAAQFDVLRSHLDESGETAIAVCGIDAANRELYCPPEVFAEVFRRSVRELRRRERGRSISLGRTFHVGEDFVHLRTGLRRIYEALIFLDLRPGDRLGHACALGIDAERWSRTTQNVEMHLIDVLDDAVFEAVLLRDSRRRVGGIDERRMSELTRAIDEVCVEVFGTTIPLVQLEKAWRLRATVSRKGQLEFRHEDSVPAWVRALHRKFPPDRHPYADAGSHSLAPQVRGNIEESIALPTDTAERIAAEYLHDIRSVRRFLRTVSVSTAGAWEHVAAVQALVADELNARGVVVESNPSSNWLIGGLESQVDVPAVRWLVASGDDAGRVPFTINPDDPTVFGASIENEYFMVFAAAVHSARTLTRTQCLREIGMLRERSLQASFLD